jgi:putative transposase
MTAQAKKGKRKRQKSGLNRSILDVGFGMLRSAIKYKIEEAGGNFLEVPAQKIKPSQTCPKCLAQKKKELSERIHQCEKCGYTADRDVASAIVCLNWALGTSVLDVEQKAKAKTPHKWGGFSPTFCVSEASRRLETSETPDVALALSEGSSSIESQ